MSTIPTVEVDKPISALTMTRKTALDNAPPYFAGLVDVFKEEARIDPTDVDVMWTTWFDVSVASDDPNAPEHEGIEKMEQLEGDMATNIHIAANVEQIDISPMRYNGGYLRIDPAAAAEALKNPSVESLNKMATTAVLNMKRNHHYHNMYRLLLAVGKGVAGSVFGVTMRTPELDEYILRALISFNGTPSFFDLEDLFLYLADQPRVMAVKVQRDETSYAGAAVEFFIGRQLSAATLSKGITAVPAMYTTGTDEEDPGFVEMPLFLPEGVDSDELDEAVDALNDGLVLLGRVASYDRDSVVYQQYINGRTLASEVLPLNLKQGALAYIHGLMSYLYTELGFVHGDLHWNNIFLERGLPYYILPLFNPDGSVRMKIKLPFRPVLIDLGMARTNQACRFTIQNGPYTVEGNDIYNLYTTARVGNDYSTKDTLGYKYLVKHTHLSQLHGELRTSYVPPYSFIDPPVTHAALLDYYIANDGVSEFVVFDEVQEAPREVVYTLRDDSKNKTITDLTEEALVLYDKDRIEASPEHDPRRFIYNYIKETAEYYR